MQRLLCMDIVCSLSENGFSLDELVFKVREVFEKKGLSGIVEIILKLMDGDICWSLQKGEPKWKPKKCCDNPRYEVLDHRERRFRTSIGEADIKWYRMICRNCNKTVIPLREFMGIERYQSKASELEKIAAEVVSEQSYRRASEHLDIIGNIPVPKSTVHRWVMESRCDEIKIEGKVVDSIFADGTGYNRRRKPEEGITN